MDYFNVKQKGRLIVSFTFSFTLALNPLSSIEKSDSKLNINCELFDTQLTAFKSLGYFETQVKLEGFKLKPFRDLNLN